MLLPLTCFGSASSKTRCKLHDPNTEMFGNTGGGYYGNNQNNGSAWRLPLFVVFYIVFLILGAAIFSAIEGPQEMQKVKSLKQMRADFLEEYPCVPVLYVSAFRKYNIMDGHPNMMSSIWLPIAILISRQIWMPIHDDELLKHTGIFNIQKVVKNGSKFDN